MNATSELIVSEYLSSLKEDTELDHLFPILLRLIGFSLIATPKDSKGQSQYGKDVIAVGKDDAGKKFRFYFEIKGYEDRNITDTVLTKNDGIIDSLKAAKYTAYNDTSIPGFNQLPVKIVLVHNGILQRNAQPTFEGLINREFPNEGEFERWDIHKLTKLFSQYLFGEYLLADDESIKLLKRTLVLLDAPDYDLADFKILVLKLLEGNEKIASRTFVKKFASLNLIASMLIHYANEGNNLEPAKKGLAFLVLQTWAWIIDQKLENREPVVRQFRKLLDLFHQCLDAYFKKTLPIASTQDGLFAENGGFFESVGYPLRALEYIGYLAYYFNQRLYWPHFNGVVPAAKRTQLYKKHRKCMETVIEMNDGCSRPLLDNHYIPILHVVLFYLSSPNFSEEDQIIAHNYIVSVFENLAIIRVRHKRWPELYSNLTSLIEFNSTNKRPFDYHDSSSILIAVLFELLAVVDGQEYYTHARTNFQKENAVNLQLPFPPEGDDIEVQYFKGNVNGLVYVETDMALPESLDELKANIRKDAKPERNLRTNVAGFPFLLFLASLYYKNDTFPSSWRSHLPPEIPNIPDSIFQNDVQS